MAADPDFIARVTYLTIAQGGRRTPAGTGHRPHTRFDGTNDLVIIEQVFAEEKEFILPGESLDAEMRVIARDRFTGKIYAGLAFEFFDGDKPIGSGTVLKVLNPELQG